MQLVRWGVCFAIIIRCLCLHLSSRLGCKSEQKMCCLLPVLQFSRNSLVSACYLSGSNLSNWQAWTCPDCQSVIACKMQGSLRQMLTCRHQGSLSSISQQIQSMCLMLLPALVVSSHDVAVQQHMGCKLEQQGK